MSTQAAPSQLSKPARIPPLQSGDRLTADEFERRFDAMPDLKKAELIDGVVYMPPPVSDEFHAQPHFDLIGWMAAYRMVTPGIVGGDNGTLRLDTKNRPQPDAYLRILPQYGGQATTDAGGYVTAAPELVAEVSASSASLDLNAKLDLYRRNRAREYLVWRVFDEAVDWYALRGTRYELLPVSADGIYRSEVLPGLWLDGAALIRRDMPTVAQVLQRGLSTPEYAAFVTRLNVNQQGAKTS